MKKNNILIIWIIIGVLMIVIGSIGLFSDFGGSNGNYIHNPREYIYGDAYNYMIDASIKSGEMALFGAARIVDAVITVAGIFLIFFSSKELRFDEIKKVDKE